MKNHTIEIDKFPGTNLSRYRVIEHTQDTATPRIVRFTGHTLAQAEAWVERNVTR